MEKGEKLNGNMERKMYRNETRTKGNLLIIIAVFICLNTSLLSQDSLSIRTFKALNYGLKTNELNLSDIWLPIDSTENNYHRLKFFDTLFANPLHSVDIIKEHTNSLLNINESDFDKYFEKVFDQLEFRKYQPIYYDNNLSTKEIDLELGFGTDTTLGNEGGQLFRLFVSPVIQIRQLLDDDFLYKNSLRLTFLKDNYKKVLLGSLNDDSNPGFDSLQKISKDFFIYSQSVNRSLMYSNGISLYQTLLKLSQIAKNNIDILKNNIKTIIIETPYGKVALGGAGNDKYEGDFTAILDIGGDDKYNISTTESNITLARFIVDLSGSDTYTGSDYTFGASSFGINILIDLSGNDIYSAKNFTFGCGVFGVGILHDLSGDDKYTGQIMSQGASAFGIGLLLDNSGNDGYDIASFGQGLAFTKGFGLLLDNLGQDSYKTLFHIEPETKTYFSFAQGVSTGYYPYASGGIGLLIDGRGNDNYRTGFCGQGFGYWFGLGALYDFNGNDAYTSFIYSQGSAINNGMGILFDNQGNDSYEAETIAQGFANDNSFALLLDDFGNDFYNILCHPENKIEYSLPSFSILIDSYGSSTFSHYIIADTNLIGKKKDWIYPEPKDKDLSFYLKIGFPLESLRHDIRDKYGDFNFSTIDTSVKNYYNILTYHPHNFEYVKLVNSLSQLDFERKHIYTYSKIDTNALQESLKSKTAEELYSRMMSGNLSIEEMNLFKNKIIENPPSVDFLAKRLGTESLFERKNLTDILSGLLAKGSMNVKNLLIDSSESKNSRVLILCLDLMSEFKIFDIVKQISELSKCKSWILRASSAKAIGKMGSVSQVDILSSLINDNHPWVRAEAAYSLGSIMPDGIMNKIHLFFYDDFSIVRKKAFMGLTDDRQLSLLFILQVLQTDLPMSARNKFASIIPTSKYTKKELKIFQQKFYNLPVNLRKIIYKSIYDSDSKVWKKKLYDFRKEESETELQKLLDKLIASMKKKGK
jgi:HEAT repeat protein